MSEENCNHDCSACGEDCPSRNAASSDFRIPVNAKSTVKHVYGIVSGKGGVGKSFVTSMLACEMKRKGKSVAVLDADITGPSIPKSFGIHGQATGDEDGIIPAQTKTGIKLMSINLLLQDEEVPVIWRGPVISGVIRQFWTDVVWGDIDYMFVDMPPGTGDAVLTVFQSLPIDGIIVVTSPQDLVSLIVAKAVNMANAMNIPIVGLVENYSYIECESCGHKQSIFGESHVDETAEKFGLKVLAKLPIKPEIAAAMDKGAVEDLEGDYLKDAVGSIS